MVHYLSIISRKEYFKYIHTCEFSIEASVTTNDGNGRNETSTELRLKLEELQIVTCEFKSISWPDISVGKSV